ncbi:hypothetical protein [Lysobacter gummosus]|uniref:hypothetical protein n=1 Tax=Lysobacter gummosus TaxID=262324 RepID=UPI003626F4D4
MQAAGRLSYVFQGRTPSAVGLVPSSPARRPGTVRPPATRRHPNRRIPLECTAARHPRAHRQRACSSAG